MAESKWLAATEEQRLKKLLRIDRRLLRQTSQPLLLPEKEFVGHYRLSKSDFARLCETLAPILPATSRTSAVRLELKILAALAFYANGCYQKNVGAYYLLGLSQTTVSDCLRDVTEALNNPGILTSCIKFPHTRLEREAIERRFMQKFGFPGVVGCVDGTHVAIIRPVTDEEAYYNRKQYHSLNVMIICDAELRILHVDASFGGQSHDSHIWNSSQVKTLMHDIHATGEACWLLGDSGYAQRDWMMVPVLNAVPNSPEEHYTKLHVRTRNVVERCIGVLKTRWRCLLAHRVMHYAPIKAGKMVNACVVLHNFIHNAYISIDEEEMMRDHAQQPPFRQHGQQHPHIDGEIGGRQTLIDRMWRSQHSIL